MPRRHDWSRHLFGPCLAGFLLAITARARGEPAKSPDDLLAEIDALRSDLPAWREIEWKSCLLEGLAESRRARKPVLLWIFIDRPADDARC